MTELLINKGIQLSLGIAVLGLIFAIILIRWVIKQSPGNEKMREIARAIRAGAKAYLNRQLLTISGIAMCIFIIISAVMHNGLQTGIGFLIGAVFSLAAGYIGMRVAVLANVRTSQAATESRDKALHVAFSGGAVTGMLVVGLALLSVGIFYLLAVHYLGLKDAVQSLIGLALGSSLISVFARLGGGIYTKAADVGADLVGKIEAGLDEDDPRNPATIADNVGDNVGDCAGMAADVFETYVVSIIGAVLVAYLSIQNDLAPIIYPFLVGGVSIIGSILGISYVLYMKGNPSNVLRMGVIVNAVFNALVLLPITKLVFTSSMTINQAQADYFDIYLCSLIGLAMTFITLVVTDYYTSTSYAPVRKIANSSESGHATNIICGLATGMHATLLPVLFICVSIALTYYLAGLYGIAIAVVAMLSMSGLIISLDAFGPITDNAGGIAVMAGLPKEVRQVTDELDAVGNTMKAVTKGYAIASAGLAAIVLFGTYVFELRAHAEQYNYENFSLENPQVIIGLFIGGLLPYLFTAFSMDAVGKAAGAVVMEVRRQLAAKPGIMKGTEQADYGTCVDIVTRSALREMIIPALLPIAFVVFVAYLPAFGAVTLGSMLVGTIVTGLFIGISMTSSGGAWDNAKKYIEEGNHGGKGSNAHAASVTGDTVGDPYKDTAGPAINPMIKVANVVAILIIPLVF